MHINLEVGRLTETAARVKELAGGFPVPPLLLGHKYLLSQGVPLLSVCWLHALRKRKKKCARLWSLACNLLYGTLFVWNCLWESHLSLWAPGRMTNGKEPHTLSR